MGPRDKSKKKSSNGNDSKEKQWKYDGTYPSLKTFNRTVMTELDAENRLAAAILRGNISVRQTQTTMGYIVTQMGMIITQLLLAIRIITSVDPDEMKKELEFAYGQAKAKTTYQKLIVELGKHENAKHED